MTSSDRAPAPDRDVRRADLRSAVELAVLAPSIHNTQPWRFAIEADRVDVFADRTRAVPVVDPVGRQLVISVGGAVFSLRTALRSMGFAVETSLLPDPGDADHLATVRVTGRREAEPHELALVAAMPQRHTNREPFQDEPVPEQTVAELSRCAEDEGAWLRRVDGPDRLVMMSLLERATLVEAADPAYRAELRNWSRLAPGAADGIPRSAVPSVDPETRQSTVALRDFDVDHSVSVVPGSVVEKPLVVLLATDGDTPRDWLQAGQALTHVLLAATAKSLASSPLGQVLDLPGPRAALRQHLGLAGYPQMLLRVGYATAAGGTPRRPVTDVLGGEGG